ncbi:hypothetical protein MAPG_12049 [Magnaporthiopsis poae ATCC 64411]|uniref:Uncharacterized protein n=1 Tax=Magnaporthiopsis poae (strain ATCC 64411 / 73-15) TaxID=644358 RepID=A0A0C4EGQ9_MAGP6|nr:hypothetical protein MAPG_12049 [Magnaporthiopsis poae ATCC 64411]
MWRSRFHSGLIFTVSRAAGDGRLPKTYSDEAFSWLGDLDVYAPSGGTALPWACHRSRQNPTRLPPRAWKKLRLPLLAATVPAVVGVVSIWLTQQSFTSEATVQWITNQRVNIQVAVQVVAAALAGLQIYAVSTLINLWTNAHVAGPTVAAPGLEDSSGTRRQAGLTVDKLKFRSAVVRSAMDFDLSSRSIAQLLAWWLLLKALAPLWAGTITPKIGTVVAQGSIEIPAYSRSTSGRWAMHCAPNYDCGSDFSFENGSLTLSEGTFNFNPWKMKTGALYSMIERASWRDADSSSKYQKQDNTGFTYQGRSYGVAASPGLATPKLHSGGGKVNGLNYTENGYLARVTCQYNRSSAVAFGTSMYVDPPNKPRTFGIGVGWAGGNLPNGKWDGCQVWSNGPLDWSVVLAAVRSSDGQYMYGTIAGSYYEWLNQTQCSVTFTPTAFKVAVDMTARSISVSPLPAVAPLDVDPTRALVNNSFHAVGYMSQTLSTLYTSVVGDALRSNTLNVARRRMQGSNNDSSDGPLGQGQAGEQDVLTSLQEAIEVVLDSSLGAIGAAQIMLTRDTRPSGADDTSLAVEAARFGESGFVYPSAALAVLLLVVVGHQLARLWAAKSPRGAAPGRGLPRSQVGHPGGRPRAPWRTEAPQRLGAIVALLLLRPWRLGTGRRITPRPARWWSRWIERSERCGCQGAEVKRKGLQNAMRTATGTARMLHHRSRQKMRPWSTIIRRLTGERL